MCSLFKMGIDMVPVIAYSVFHIFLSIILQIVGLIVCCRISQIINKLIDLHFQNAKAVIKYYHTIVL